MNPPAIQEGGCTQLPPPHPVGMQFLNLGNLPLRRTLAVILPVVLAAGAGYLWYRQQLWVVAGAAGQPKCRVEKGWLDKDVAEHCGAPDGRGQQVKVFESKSLWKPLARACSAPGDVYGAKAVLYDCDGRVYAVERLPVPQFAYRWQ